MFSDPWFLLVIAIFFGLCSLFPLFAYSLHKADEKYLRAKKLRKDREKTISKVYYIIGDAYVGFGRGSIDDASGSAISDGNVRYYYAGRQIPPSDWPTLDLNGGYPDIRVSVGHA